MKKKWINILKIYLQCQAIYVDKKNLNKCLHILEYGASGCASGDIEQVIVKKYKKYDKLQWDDDIFKIIIW